MHLAELRSEYHRTVSVYHRERGSSPSRHRKRVFCRHLRPGEQRAEFSGVSATSVIHRGSRVPCYGLGSRIRVDSDRILLLAGEGMWTRV